MYDVQPEDIDPETGWSSTAIQLTEHAVSNVRSNKATSGALFRQGPNAILHVGKQNVYVLSPQVIELFSWLNVSRLPA